MNVRLKLIVGPTHPAKAIGSTGSSEDDVVAWQVEIVVSVSGSEVAADGPATGSIFASVWATSIPMGLMKEIFRVVKSTFIL